MHMKLQILKKYLEEGQSHFYGDRYRCVGWNVCAERVGFVLVSLKVITTATSHFRSLLCSYGFPCQTDGINCGVHILAIANFVPQNIAISYRNDHLPEMRRVILYQLIKAEV